MKNLECLHLRGCHNLQNVGSIFTLTNLTELYLTCKKLQIDGISNLIKLRDLGLDCRLIMKNENLNAITKLSKLVHLTLYREYFYLGIENNIGEKIKYLEKIFEKTILILGIL